MQKNTGLRSLLALPVVYRLTNFVFSKPKFIRWFLDTIIDVRDGQKLVDIGCGPADILADLGQAVEYVGLDISTAYIDAARERYGARGLFIAGSVNEWVADARISGADVVLCYGLLHHVDDLEATQILRFAHRILAPGGRLVFLEPCYLIWQSQRSVFMMSKDRGQNIRTERQWKSLVTPIFAETVTNIVTSGNRLGYTHIVGQCTKSIA